MSRLIAFFRAIYLFILFLVVEGVAIMHFLNSDAYIKAHVLSYSSYVTGPFYSLFSSIGDYTSLPKQNRELLGRVIELERENIALREALDVRLDGVDSLGIDRLFINDIVGDSTALAEDLTQLYTYIPARVISNSINSLENYIVLNRGLEDGVREDMALITQSGSMLGYIVGCSARYSVAMSMLNSKFKTSGKLLKDNNFGSVWWSGKSAYSVQMQDLSKYAQVERGDTIISTGFSQIFPKGVTIGYVEDFQLNEMETGFEVEIDIAAEISAVDRVLIVGTPAYGEVNSLLEFEMEESESEK